MRNPQQKTKIISGVFWSFLMRWSTKFIGLINTVILARLLTPDDFGIVAMGTLVIAFVEELSTINIPLLLIRIKEPSKAFDNTGWTFGILQSSLTAVLLLLLAPVAAWYFDDDRVCDVIYFLALIRVIVSFRNVGMIIARRDLNFSLDYKYMVTTRVVSLFSVIILAYTLRDYWALVYGLLLAEIFNVFLSYWMFKYRPRFSIKHIKECFKFAFSTVPLFFARTLSYKFDVLLVGRFSGTAVMGIYNVANELVSIFTNELVISVSRGMFPNFSLLANDKVKFNNVYTQVVTIAFTFSAPIGFGLWVVANDLVLVILGGQWLESVVFIRWLVIYGVFTSIISLMSEHPLIALGREKQANYLVWLRLLVLIPCVIFGYNEHGIEGIAMGMAFSSIVNFLIIGPIVCKLLEIKFSKILQSFFRPVISAMLMCYAVYLFVTMPSLDLLNLDFLRLDVPLVRLIIELLLGIISYTLCLLFLWFLQGKPKGIESSVLDRLFSSVKN